MNPQPIGLLWYKPPEQTFILAARHARRRFIERDGREPGVVLLNPCHQAEFQSPTQPGQLSLPLPIATLDGLAVQFDKDVRPNHLLVVAGDEQKNSQRTAQHAGHFRTSALGGDQ